MMNAKEVAERHIKDAFRDHTVDEAYLDLLAKQEVSNKVIVEAKKIMAAHSVTVTPDKCACMLCAALKELEEFKGEG